jgi:hypothetical protein
MYNSPPIGCETSGALVISGDASKEGSAQRPGGMMFTRWRYPAATCTYEGLYSDRRRDADQLLDAIPASPAIRH